MLPIKGLDPTFGLNREAVEAAQSHLLKHYYTPYQDSIAFIIQRLNGTQLSLDLIKNVNKAVKINPLREISIYTMQKDIPISIVNTAVYPIQELRQYHGTVVYLDIPSFEFGTQNVPNHGCFYIYDAWFLSQVRPNIPQNKLKLWNDQKHIRYITRSSDHQKLIKQSYGWDSQVIPDLNIYG